MTQSQARRTTITEAMARAGFHPDRIRTTLSCVRDMLVEWNVSDPKPVERELERLNEMQFGKTWRVNVSWVRDHESLKEGRTVDGWSHVVVLARTPQQAQELASQIVAGGKMPTSAQVEL